MSLANKYRPKNFDTVIGQTHITDILKAKMKSDKGGHSNFLLFGPRGTGKTSSARILAKAMNCLNLQDGNPCNECANCQTINSGTTLDYIEIDAASHTGVDNIREEILDKAIYPPTMLKKKIYVIDEVHMLSKGAFNALLKTIELPKDTMAFILATTEIHKVPETIISRCQVFNFKKIPEKEMIQHLESICTQEGLSYVPAALQLIAKISEGCARDAIKYLDQVSILGEVNEEHVTNFLGVASEASIREFLQHIKSGERETIFAMVSNLHEHGVDLQQFAKQILTWIDEHLGDDTDFLLKISESFAEILGMMRYYPYPAMAYKIVINKFLSPEVVIHQPPVVVKTTPKSEEEPISQEQIPSLISGKYTEILTNLLEKIDKPSLQKNLKEHFLIEDITDTEVKVVVINSMTKLLLDKHENMTYIENIFETILGRKIRLQMRYEAKESYFEKLLG